MTKRSLFSPLCTSWMLLWRLLLVFTYQGRVRRYCSEPSLAFPWTEVLKLLKGLTVGQAVLEIPLSEGSKLELHSLCPISVYFPVHSRICPRMYIHVYILPCIFILY